MPLTLLLHGHHAQEMRYEPLGPWLVPWRFTNTAEEYQALRTRVGLIDDSIYASIEVQGSNRVDFLHRLLSHDIKRLVPGGGCRAALLTPSATLVADLLVLADAEALWLLCPLPEARAVKEALERYLFTEDVRLIPHERRFAVFGLQGPKAMELAGRLIGTPLSLASVADHLVQPVRGVPLRWVRWSLTSDEGLLCCVESAQAPACWEWLIEAGRPYGLQPVGWEALHIARIEAGLPWMGLDMDETNLLPETGLEATIASDTKGCYVGQEVVARMRTYGSPRQKLMGLLIEGAVVPHAGDAIVYNDAPAGRVTSACHSLALQRPIAMGYVKRGAYEPGTSVQVVRGETRLIATVTCLPFSPSSVDHSPS